MSKAWKRRAEESAYRRSISCFDGFFKEEYWQKDCSYSGIRHKITTLGGLSDTNKFTLVHSSQVNDTYSVYGQVINVNPTSGSDTNYTLGVCVNAGSTSFQFLKGTVATIALCGDGHSHPTGPMIWDNSYQSGACYTDAKNSNGVQVTCLDGGKLAELNVFSEYPSRPGAIQPRQEGCPKERGTHGNIPSGILNYDHHFTMKYWQEKPLPTNKCQNWHTPEPESWMATNLAWALPLMILVGLMIVCGLPMAICRAKKVCCFKQKTKATTQRAQVEIKGIVN